MAFWSIGHILNKIFDSATSALGVKVTGSSVAHDAVDSENPLKIGGRATSSLPAAVADGDRVNATYTTYGAAHVNLRNASGTEPNIGLYGNTDAINGAATQAFAAGALTLGYNGTTWDRLRSVNTGQLVVTLKDSAGDAVDIVSPSGDAHTVTNSMSVQAYMEAFNNTNHDRWRNNTEGTLLASAARTATASSTTQTNYNARGVFLLLDITAVPSVDTVRIQLQYQVPGSATWFDLVNTATTAATGQITALVYPGATGGAASVLSAILPRTWRANVVHVGSGSFTYSLGSVLIV